MTQFRYVYSRLTFEEVRSFLVQTDSEYPTPLSQSVDIDSYAHKLSDYSDFSLCYAGEELVGMISCYTNRPPIGYVSNVCIKKAYQGKGVFSKMLGNLIDKITEKGIGCLFLEVSFDNIQALDIYFHLGFVIAEAREEKKKFLLELSLCP